MATILVSSKFFKYPQIKHKAILDYLKLNYHDLIEKYKHRTQSNGQIPDNCPIWFVGFKVKVRCLHS